MLLRNCDWVPCRFTGKETEWERLENGLDRTPAQGYTRWEVYMLPQNDYLMQREYLDYRVDALAEDARQRRLLSDAGIVRRPWLSCQVCRSLWRLGHLMVTAGHRLEQRYAPMSLSRA
jgi:hypothetical protein